MNAHNRGIVLIVSFLMLTVFLAYSTTLTMRTMTERLATERKRESFQALDLAQGTLEQMREDFYRFHSSNVYQLAYQGDAVKAMTWLDTLGSNIRDPQVLTKENPLFDLNGDAKRDGTSTDPRCITTGLPTVKSTTCAAVGTPTQAPRAWITDLVSTDATNSLAPRRMTIRAEATVGSTTKIIEAIYEIVLGPSDIFKYAYFVNNYGWFDVPSSTWVYINGEVRSNGDLKMDGYKAGTPLKVYNMYVQGDLYASNNPQVKDPRTGIVSTGVIVGDPNQHASRTSYLDSFGNYPNSRRSRPTRDLTFPGQPAIGNPALPKILPYGSGWDTQPRPTGQPAFPNQEKFPNQDPQPIPYLGNLGLYKTLAMTYSNKNGGTGSVLTYKDLGPDLIADGNDTDKTISGIYAGPDSLDPTDDHTPLVLVGTSTKPVNIDGPIVATGDVIIKGYVTGRGTIYSGRNIHIVGELIYVSPNRWYGLERETHPQSANPGRIRERSSTGNLGTVCNDGSYYAPGVAPPPQPLCVP